MATKLLSSTLGRDIYQADDYKRTPTGDIATVSGLENLLLRIDRMLITNPGEIFHRPDFGIGIRRFLNQSNSSDQIARMKNAIIKNLSQDSDIQKVSAVQVRRQETGVVVRIAFIPKGASAEVQQDFGFKI